MGAYGKRRLAHSEHVIAGTSSSVSGGEKDQKVCFRGEAQFVKLLERARKEHSRSGYIETRRENGTSLFLSWWSDMTGTLYELRHGLYGGKTILICNTEPLKRRIDLERTHAYGVHR